MGQQSTIIYYYRVFSVFHSPTLKPLALCQNLPFNGYGVTLNRSTLLTPILNESRLQIRSLTRTQGTWCDPQDPVVAKLYHIPINLHILTPRYISWDFSNGSTSVLDRRDGINFLLNCESTCFAASFVWTFGLNLPRRPTNSFACLKRELMVNGGIFPRTKQTLQ